MNIWVLVFIRFCDVFVEHLNLLQILDHVPHIGVPVLCLQIQQI